MWINCILKYKNETEKYKKQEFKIDLKDWSLTRKAKEVKIDIPILEESKILLQKMLDFRQLAHIEKAILIRSSESSISFS